MSIIRILGSKFDPDQYLKTYRVKADIVLRAGQEMQGYGRTSETNGFNFDICKISEPIHSQMQRLEIFLHENLELFGAFATDSSIELRECDFYYALKYGDNDEILIGESQSIVVHESLLKLASDLRIELKFSVYP